MQKQKKKKKHGPRIKNQIKYQNTDVIGAAFGTEPKAVSIDATTLNEP